MGKQNRFRSATLQMTRSEVYCLRLPILVLILPHLLLGPISRYRRQASQPD